MEAQFLSPIKEMGQVLARKIRALPFWWSYVLIALFLIGSTGLYLWWN